VDAQIVGAEKRRGNTSKDGVRRSPSRGLAEAQKKLEQNLLKTAHYKKLSRDDE